ncbi:MAG: tRNA dihydrouridine(20/20a) synthase DusA [Alphaproteobacteria bacterium]|nr:tRNA dihydrouridine(20/20a) synthase DusA [Alphaproteobacteria bacterium]
MTASDSHRLCVAPMMGWTDRHQRVFARTLTRHARLYTEMVTADAVLHGDRARLIGFSDVEHPLALQLGGSEPAKLGRAARIGEGFGYDEINLNVGCPSDRVQAGRFGACLMAEPGLVADCVAAMIAAVRIPVTVKCRIGIDDQDPEEALFGFVGTVAGAGARIFVVHARKAWLKGLSPKENREVPPLDYAIVRRLKAAWPELRIVLNGGLETLDAAAREGAALDGVMLGRAAYQNPYLLAEADARLFGDEGRAPTRAEAVRAMLPYIAERLEDGASLNAVTRHMLGLYAGEAGARTWRRALTEGALAPQADARLVEAALEAVEAARARHAAMLAA